MPTFEPPYRSFEPPTLPEDRDSSPAKFFANGVRKGVNVWIKNDGTLTESYPGVGYYTGVYYGGHIYTVTDAEAAVITAAGYTVT